MSIHNLSSKIKGIRPIDKITFMYLFVVVLVGFCAFGLGRLSVSVDKSISTEVLLTDSVEHNTSNFISSNTNAHYDSLVQKTSVSSTSKNYIASKNGKLYYTIGCSGSKRIKDSNAVYFASTSDAEKLGYTSSPSCH